MEYIIKNVCCRYARGYLYCLEHPLMFNLPRTTTRPISCGQTFIRTEVSLVESKYHGLWKSTSLITYRTRLQYLTFPRNFLSMCCHKIVDSNIVQITINIATAVKAMVYIIIIIRVKIRTYLSLTLPI